MLCIYVCVCTPAAHVLQHMSTYVHQCVCSFVCMYKINHIVCTTVTYIYMHACVRSFVGKCKCTVHMHDTYVYNIQTYAELKWQLAKPLIGQ